MALIVIDNAAYEQFVYKGSIQDLLPKRPLTPMQERILRLLQEGKSINDITSILGIERHITTNHIANMQHKGWREQMKPGA